MAQPSPYEAHCEQARQHLKQRQFAEAISVYQQALALDPDGTEAHEGIAAACTFAGQIDQAIEHLLTLTRLAPRNAKAFVNLGALYNRQGDYPKAVEMCRRAVQIDRKSADGYYNQGVAYRKMNQLALAVPAYREALRINPQMAIAHQNLANVYVDMGNRHQAVQHFKLALEVDPNFEKARIGLEKAQEAKQAQKTSANPFGRLVDTDAVETASSAVVKLRTLTDSERADDRTNLSVLNRMTYRAARDLRNLLRDKLEPCLVELSRSVMGGDADIQGLVSQLQPFCKDYQYLARNLEGATREIGAHQERMLKLQSAR